MGVTQDGSKNQQHMTSPSHLSSRSSSLPLLMWGGATLLYFYQFFLRSSPTVLVDELMHDFSVTAEELGVLVSFYYIAYAALQIPMGLIIDRIGLRKTLTFSSLGCAIGTAFFSFSESLLMAQIGRLLVGIGAASVFLSCLKLISLWFPKRQFSVFTGLTLMTGTFGAIIGGAPLAFLLQEMSWRATLQVVAVIGILISLFLWFVIRDRKAPLGLAMEAPPPLLKTLLLIAQSKVVWIASFYGMLMYAVLSGFADLWGTPFLMAAYGLDRPEAAASTSIIYIGLALGAPIFGYLSEKLRSRKIPMLAAPVGALLSFLVCIYGSDIGFLWIQVALFGVGFFVGGKLMNFTITTDVVPSGISATATGFVNTFTMLSGVIFQPFIGFLMGWNWDGTIIDGVARYTLEDYRFALAALPTCMILAVALTFMCKETYPK